MTEGMYPVPDGHDGAFELHIMCGRLVVKRADKFVAVSTELWSDMLNAIHDGGEGYPVIDADESTVTFGTPGKGIGVVVYRLEEQVLGWYLLERVS